MKGISEMDRVLKNLFEDSKPVGRVVTIDSPTSNGRKDSLGVQRSNAEYVESYVNLGKFFVV